MQTMPPDRCQDVLGVLNRGQRKPMTASNDGVG
jgi:hypothetical protein